MPAEEIAPGVRLDYANGKVVLHFRLQAYDGAAALHRARELADDFFQVAGAPYAAFRYDPQDERDRITRTDAVVTPVDQPIPAPDVAEGHVSEAGMDWFDPTGEARRAGKVVRVRAHAKAGRQTRPIIRQFAGHLTWTPRLRSALALFWAGQCSPDRRARFVLAVAALEVLADRPRESLLSARLAAEEVKRVRQDVATVLTDVGKLSRDDVERLVNQLASAHAVGARATLIGYLTEMLPADAAFIATAEDISSWQKQRGRYLHEGYLDPSLDASCDRCNAVVGELLRRELDKALR